MEDGRTDSHASSGDLYHDDLIGMLELLWGEGFLSPGGPDEVARVVSGLDLTGRSVLDIGCGVGGVDVALIQRFGAGWVTGVDVEDTVLAAARRRVERHGLSSRIGVAKVAPGPLPFPPGSFDVVFSKDSIVHIPDKHALCRDVARVLVSGGWFAASDWLIGHDGEPSPAMRDYLAAEGLDFGMASPGAYRAALDAAGFVDIEVTSRHEWYVDVARRELESMRGPLRQPAVDAFGVDFVEHNIDIWTKMLVVLATGEHRPTHIRARKPGR
ncbi:MAG: methyltransferase domain-containing protein [Actinobacteria bacterium]|nr:methyltransferase domain-containing protein [Actinomycetota bacterium]